MQAQDIHQSSAASTTKSSTIKTNEPDPNDGNLGYHLMTEDELLLELNAEGQKMYQSMDAKNKELTLKVASARCANTSECKGLNACKTEKMHARAKDLVKVWENVPLLIKIWL